MDHRVESRDLPDIGDAHLQAICEIEHTRRIEITTLALHDEHQRQDRRACHGILRDMLIDLLFHLRGKLRGLNTEIDGLGEWLDVDDLCTHAYLSISPNTISSDPMIATIPATIAPSAKRGNADKFTKLGARK